MHFSIIVFPGSNCDQDCHYLVKDLLGQKASFVWHKEKLLPKTDCVILPGGFSYGDYLRCGAIARFSPIMQDIVKFAEAGGKVMGICNGFQILTEAHLLPGVLLRNKNLNFICKNIFLKVSSQKTPFTQALALNSVLQMPIAHMEGNYFIEAEGLEELQQNSQIVFRYSDEKGDFTAESNPNGALENIAGICNKKGNVLGLMPHPERIAETLLGGRDGKLLFESLTDL